MPKAEFQGALFIRAWARYMAVSRNQWLDDEVGSIENWVCKQLGIDYFDEEDRTIPNVKLTLEWEAPDAAGR